MRSHNLHKGVDYSCCLESLDINRCNKLNEIIMDKTTTLDNYWDRVRALTSRVRSDHGIHRWQCLSEYYYNKLVVK